MKADKNEREMLTFPVVIEFHIKGAEKVISLLRVLSEQIHQLADGVDEIVDTLTEVKEGDGE